MITIYSADASTGRLYTDEKQHFYIDGELLREKAVRVKTAALLDQIALRLGWRSFGELDTFARCAGVARQVLLSWILAGRFDLVRSLMTADGRDD